MPKLTNTSLRVIHLPDGAMILPGGVADLADEHMENPGVKALTEEGDLRPASEKDSARAAKAEDAAEQPRGGAAQAPSAHREAGGRR